jgi:hypothetical protein
MAKVCYWERVRSRPKTYLGRFQTGNFWDEHRAKWTLKLRQLRGSCGLWQVVMEESRRSLKQPLAAPA